MMHNRDTANGVIYHKDNNQGCFCVQPLSLLHKIYNWVVLLSDWSLYVPYQRLLNIAYL